MRPVRIYSEEIEFNVKGEFDIIDLTSKVNIAVMHFGIKEGVAIISSKHTTGIIILNEYETRIFDDLKNLLRKLIPSDKEYEHRENGFAHLRSILLMSSKIVPVHAGELSLGVWQSLYWLEADRQSRNRLIEVTVIGE